MNQRRIVLAVVVLALVGGAVVITRQLTESNKEDIFLEGAGQTGPNPFTMIAATTATTVPGGPTTTALFGGSGDQKVCDPEALITFLGANPDKAAAWVAALNADDKLIWSGGTKLTVADIPTYIRELTPTFLSKDTRVTNHGYVNGKATPRQSLLQAGTAVLVDRNDIPRVRCACGNPLTPPHEVDDPNYEGECWPGCLDEPPCAPPGCTDPTTTTTTVPQTTTTCVPIPGANNCGPIRTTTTFRPPIRTTTTSPPTVTRPSTTTTQPPPIRTTTTKAPDPIPG